MAQFICFERKDGVCHKSEVQLLSDDSNSINLEKFTNFKNKIADKFCQKYDFYVDQFVDLCRIADLLSNIVQYSDMIQTNPSPANVVQTASQMQKRPCKLSDIPVEESKFKVSQLAGLWYEISRTYNAVNKFESSVAYFEYSKDNTMHSYYSGTINNKCSPAISSYTKPLVGGRWAAEMEARLDGPQEIFPWLPFKIVYYDGMYSVHYGCFNQDGKGNCLQAEASIYGRRPTIDQHIKDKIYRLFPSLCLSTEDIQDISHNIDCSEWVTPYSESRSTYCTVDNVPYQTDLSMERMLGSWYVIGSSNIEANRVYIRRYSETFSLDIFGKQNGDCSLLFTAVIVNEDITHGNWLVSVKNGDKTPIYSMKLVFSDYQEAILYECFEENIRGECTTNGTKIMLLSRTSNPPPTTLPSLVAKLKLPCSEPSSITATTEFCQETPRCFVNDIPVVGDLDIQKLSGIWYKMFTTNGRNAVIKLRLDGDSYLNLDGVVALENGTCFHNRGKLRGRTYFKNGDLLGKQMLPKKTYGFFPFKVVHTDYDNVLITYTCSVIMPDGTCGKDGEKLDILSRNKSAIPDVENSLIKFVKSTCIDTERLVQITEHDECSYVLDDLQDTK